MKIRHFDSREYRKKRRRRPINVLASTLTTMSLYLGVASIFASIGMEFETAAYMILGAWIFDILDGTVARLTKTTSEFGKELDSLCDMVSFGVAPGVLVFMCYLPPEGMMHLPISEKAESIVGKTGSYLAIVYVICAALRLARFNTWQADRRDSFIGLPSPASGGAIASFVLFLQYYEPRLENHELGPLAYYALGPLALLLAFLMVSNVSYPKDRMKSFVFEPLPAFQILGFCAFAIAVIHYAITTSPSIAIFPIAMFYVLFGIGETFYRKIWQGITETDMDEEGGWGESESEEEEEEEAPPQESLSR
jgi:CDP-diacylglycerol---serine O-phosphatidyltransferase